MAGSRNPARTRRLLLDAGVRVLKRHYEDASRERPPLPVSVSEVLRELRQHPADGDEPVELTAGAVQKAFGSKPRFLEEVAEHLIAPDEVVGALLAVAADAGSNLEDPVAVRRQLLLGDLRNTAETVATTRHWFAAHSQAANPVIAEQLRRVYAGVDAAFVPLYESIGMSEGRVPRDGMSWQHVSIAMTAWLEGFAMRHHYLPDGSKETPWQTAEEASDFFVSVGLGIWTSLTKPA